MKNSVLADPHDFQRHAEWSRVARGDSAYGTEPQMAINVVLGWNSRNTDPDH